MQLAIMPCGRVAKHTCRPAKRLLLDCQERSASTSDLPSAFSSSASSAAMAPATPAAMAAAATASVPAACSWLRNFGINLGTQAGCRATLAPADMKQLQQQLLLPLEALLPTIVAMVLPHVEAAVLRKAAEVGTQQQRLSLHCPPVYTGPHMAMPSLSAVLPTYAPKSCQSQPKSLPSLTEEEWVMLVDML